MSAPPSVNVREELEAQKGQLLSQLAQEIMLPVTDISIHTIPPAGVLRVKIDDSLALPLRFLFRNKKFSWEIDNGFRVKLAGVWRAIFYNHQEEIIAEAAALLGAENDELDRVTLGDIHVVYVYRKDIPNPTAVIVQYTDGSWTARER